MGMSLVLQMLSHKSIGQISNFKFDLLMVLDDKLRDHQVITS